MKGIITSLGMIVFAGAVVAGGTGAFFSDTETSTGNVFTAGAIDLKVDSQQHYNGNVCVVDANDVNKNDDIEEYVWIGEASYPVEGTACNGTWTQTDLGLTHKFFDFGDVKPGDEGENTISLHIDNNDAWMCADVNITKNDDMSCVDPENQAEGAGVCGTDDINPLMDGELAQNLWFVAWNDNGVDANGEAIVDAVPGDNIHQAGEPLLFEEGPASNVLNGGTLTIADGGTGTPIPGGSDSFIGLAWCAGKMIADTNSGTPTCDGSTMLNDAQTDSMTADITFRVEQARNNGNFRCDARGV